MRWFRCRSRTLAVLGLSLLAGCHATEPRAASDAARLMDHVRALSTGIGPRPPGGEADRRVQEYIRQALERAGLETRIEEVDRVPISDRVDLYLGSGNVVGVLPGTRRGAILVGAHHDTRGPRCPGAADDASGVAVVLETARLLAGRSHHHTLVFVSFAGEETWGLPGSWQFLRNWSADPFLLAITLDFVGSGKVFVAPFPASPDLWASRLLARAARKSHSTGASFDPWLVAVPRILRLPFWSDHASFLAKGIPALNLSCQFPAWIYHTSEDLPNRIDARTLLAARDLVVEMVSDTDDRGRVETAVDPFYLPLTLFGRPLLIPGRALRLVALGTFLLALLTFWRARGDMASVVAWGEGIRALLMALPLTALMVGGPFLVERLLSRISGFRHPWYARPEWHLSGALLAGAFTVWLSLSLSRFIRPSILPGSYLTPAILIQFSLAAGILLWGRLDLAFPFLVGTAFMLLAAWSGSAVRRGALGMVGVSATVPFLSPTTYRMFLELGGVNLPGYALPLAVGVLALPWFLFVQHLSCLPETLHARPGGFLTRGRTGAALGGLALLAGVLNALGPSYDRDHRALVNVRQELDPSRGRAEIDFSSLETLRGIRLDGKGGRSLPDATETRIVVPLGAMEPPSLEISTEPLPGGELLCRIRGTLPADPRSVSVTISGRAKFQVERSGTWEEKTEYRRVVYRTDRTVDEEVRLRGLDAGPLSLETVVTFEEDLLGLRPVGRYRVFNTVAFVRQRKRIT